MNRYQWAVMEADLNTVVGAEQKVLRPELIVSNEEYNQAMPNVTILPLTSTQRRLYPSEVILKQGKAGQPRESIIMAHQIRTISKIRLVRTIGNLEDLKTRIDVINALKEHLDLD